MANDRIQVQNLNDTARTMDWTLTVQTPSTSQKVYFCGKAAFAFSILGVYLRAESGTGTVTVKKNGTGQTGLSNLSISSGTGETTLGSPISVAVGDEVSFSFATVSSLTNACVELKVRRTS
jgi:hypothetical protein